MEQVGVRIACHIDPGAFVESHDIDHQRVGHWENDTLVVDVVGFNEGTWIDMAGDPHTNLFHLAERYTRTDMRTLHYEATIDDAGAYTKPWKIQFDIAWDPNGEIQEYVCQENNRWQESLMESLKKE